MLDVDQDYWPNNLELNYKQKEDKTQVKEDESLAEFSQQSKDKRVRKKTKRTKKEKKENKQHEYTFHHQKVHF